MEETVPHRFVYLVLLLAVLGARPALADDAAEAKAHYSKATAHYAVGEYKEAAGEYEAAFKLRQDPALLYNAAQSHRLAGDNPRALLLYKNLVKLYPSTKYATEAKDRIERLEQAVATSQSPPNSPAPIDGAGAPPAAAAPPPGAASGAPATGSPPPVAMPPARATTNPAPGATLATAPTPSAPSTGQTEAAPVYKRWWFWAAAGGLVAAGVITAIALSGSTAAWANVPEVRGSSLRQGVGW
jgi:tetratricopeptide (TPR) repeat protein